MYKLKFMNNTKKSKSEPKKLNSLQEFANPNIFLNPNINVSALAKANKTFPSSKTEIWLSGLKKLN